MSYLPDSRAQSFVRKLRFYEDAHPTAKTQGKSSCCNSGLCCWTRPPRLTQEDLARLAKLNGLEPGEFFHGFCVIDDPAGGGNVPVLIREHQSTYSGHYLPEDETYSTESPCCFLTVDNRCSVHENKPTECAKYKCWASSHGTTTVKWTREELLALGWDGTEDDY